MKQPNCLPTYQTKYDRLAILDFIVSYKQGHDGNSPTMRQIAAELGISSTSVVAYWLHNLAATGMIRLPGATARGIEVVGGRWQWVKMPAEMGR